MMKTERRRIPRVPLTHSEELEAITQRAIEHCALLPPIPKPVVADPPQSHGVLDRFPWEPDQITVDKQD